MEKKVGPSDVQLLKTPSGDAMMVVAIPKETLESMLEKGLVLGIFGPEIQDFKLPQCLARYDRLRISTDYIIQPGLQQIK